MTVPAKLLPEELITWAKRHRIGPDALHELNALLTGPVPELTLDYDANTETYNQNTVRVLASSREHTYLWRNNNGAVQDAGGRLIRYGIANDSKKINQRFKSSDLIGITPITITAAMQGMRVGVFTALEMKKTNWRPGEDTQRERAQLRYINTVRAAGGLAMFCNNPLQYQQLLDYWNIPNVRSRYHR